MKKARKILVGLMAMVMLLGMCMTVNAEGSEKPAALIKSIKANSATVYTNGTDAEKQITVSYTWDSNKYSAPNVSLTAGSSNRGVVKVGEISQAADVTDKGKTTSTVKINLQPEANGKAVITIKGQSTSKNANGVTQIKSFSKKVNVTVKTWAEAIEFGDVVVVDEENVVSGNTITIANTKGTSVNLGAVLSNADLASNKAISYKVEKEFNNNTTKTGITVDKKGNVKVTANKVADIKDTVITVKSTDKNVNAPVRYVTVKTTEPLVTDFELVQDTTSTKDELGLLNKKNVLNLKNNKLNMAYTYQLAWTGDVPVKDLDFESSKESVAKVDRKTGVVTAVGNGTAKITVKPRLGNKLAKAKTITVKVTTDVEYVKVAKAEFRILANNKASANIAATTNPNASKKTVDYAITSVEAGGKVYTGNDIKAYASISKKGVVKAKKGCVINVTATAAADTSIYRKVKVYADVPVDQIKIGTMDGSVAATNAKGTAFTVYKTGANENDQQKLDLTAKTTAKETIGKEPTDGSVTWTSNKESVAKVDPETGVVTAVGNGKATITAKANDNSGKKASVTVTVKVDAYEILVAKAQKVEDSDVVYVLDNAGKDYTLTKVIAATTNTNASNKKLAYYNGDTKITKIKVPVDTEGALITIKAADERKHGVNSAAADQVTRTIRLVSVSESAIAKEFKVNGMPADGTRLLIGEIWKGEMPLSIEATDGGKILDKSAVTLTAEPKNVVAVNKNGTLTAKKEGKATITAKVNNKVVGDPVTVYVGRKTADVEKLVEKSISNALKAENRDYVGLKTKFDAKKNAFALEITNPTNDFTKLKDTGIIAALKAIILENSSLAYKTISLYDDQDNWTAEISGLQADVNYNGSVVLEDAGIADAVNYILTATTKGAEQLKDWNGKNYTLEVVIGDEREHGTFDHTLSYNVTTTMEAAAYDVVVDTAIAEQISKFAVDGLAFTYDADCNCVEVYVTKPMTIAEADADSRTVLLDAMNVIFEDATEVTLSATVNGEPKTVTKERADQSTEYINELLNEYVEKLAKYGIETLDNLEGTVMAADVTYEVGAQKYDFTYETKILLDAAVFDARIDAEIVAAIEANRYEFAYGTLNYDMIKNVLNLDIDATYHNDSIISLATADLDEVVAAVINNSKAESVIVNATGTPAVIELSGDAKKDAGEILLELAKGDAVTLKDLDGKTASIEVVYPSVNGLTKRTLEYTIMYTTAAIDADYTLVWEDQFFGNELNRNDWNVELHEPGWVNEEWQAYVDSEDNIYVEDGNLVIQPLKIDNGDGTYSYTSGRVNTQNKHDFKYGRYEAKVKVPSGMGYLPAFWMMPTDESYYGQWPKCGEIDIMEVMGQSTDTLHGTIHYGDPHGQKQGTYVIEEGPDFAEDYHVYAVDWEPGKITWYVDGVKFHEATDWYTKREGFDETAFPAPFDQPFYMILNVAVGGSWVGYPDETTEFGDNAQMVVDYVRVYQKDASYYEELENTVIKPAAQEVPDSEIGENLLKNGDFSEGTENWSFLTANGGAGSMAVTEAEELKIITESEGSVDYSVQLVQGPLALKQGNRYKVSFDAYADEARRMNTMLTAPDLNYIRYWGDTVVNLTTQKQHFEYEFDMVKAGDANSRFEMTFGAMDSKATVYLDNITVEKVSSFEVKEEPKTVLPDGNYIYNGSFDISNTGTNDRMKYWAVSADAEGAAFTVTNSNGVREFKAVVPETVNALDAVVLAQRETAVSGGKDYLFTVDTHADAEKTIKVKVRPYDEYGNYIEEAGFESDIEVGTEKTTKTMKFTMPEGVVGSDIEFYVGVAGTTYIDNVRIQEDAILVNGNFSSGTTGWVTTHVYGSAKASFAIDELDNGNGTPALAVNITNTGSADWNIQLTQAVTLEEGKCYRVAFDAWSTLERKLLFAIQRNADKHGGDNQWTSYSGDIKETLSTEGFKHYEKAFKMTSVTDDIAEVKFTMGAVDGQITTPHTIFIDNVTLEEIDESELPEVPVTPAGDNMFSNSDFATGELDPWELSYYTPGADGHGHTPVGGEASAIVEDGKVVVDVKNPGCEDGTVALKYNGLTLEKDASYKLTFKAIAEETRQIKPCFMDPVASYKWYGGKEFACEAGVETSIELNIDVTEATSSNILFQVGLGVMPNETTPACKVTMYDFVLVKVGGGSTEEVEIVVEETEEETTEEESETTVEESTEETETVVEEETTDEATTEDAIEE